MELVTILRELWSRKLALAAIFLLAVVVALSTAYKLPSMEPRAFEYAAASTQILIDSKSSSLGDRTEDLAPLTTRAAVFARFMTSEAVTQEIAKSAGVPATKIASEAPLPAEGVPIGIDPEASKRGAKLIAEGKFYRLFLQAELSLPTVAVYAQAPDTKTAERLADAAFVGLRNYMSSLQGQTKIREADQIEISQLGPAEGTMVNEGMSKAVMLLAFGTVFIGGCVALLLLTRFLEAWRFARAEEAEPEEPVGWPQAVDDEDPRWEGPLVAGEEDWGEKLSPVPSNGGSSKRRVTANGDSD